MLFQTLLPRSLPFVSTGSISPELQTFAASALARTIADQRQHVIADGVRSLPPTISRAMAGYFPETILRKCRYAIGDAQKIKLPTVRLTYGDGEALTLVDTVLFHSDMAAQTDRACWARQLTQVMQFQRLGLDEFARCYVCERRGLEREVASTVSRFATWSRDRMA